MVPFFIFYSMFGFQRVADLIWAAADMRSKGFLMGATSGRTTLNGEGLQHQDGHSHLISATVPNCISYDPTFGYELAVIINDGLKRMYADDESVFYYITLLNENYAHPPIPKGVEEGIRRGMYQLEPGAKKSAKAKPTKPKVQLLGSGSILREVIAAADLLESDFGVDSDLWSVPSFTELRRDGIEIERWNRLHPTAKRKISYVEECLEGHEGPVVASTDFMRSFADQIRQFVPGRYLTLGTDGFGRSDTRASLRGFFEIDRYHVTVAALMALADEGTVPAKQVADAIKKYDIDTEAPDPWTV
jgi:pyruvate dehydrogenase E1 component